MILKARYSFRHLMLYQENRSNHLSVSEETPPSPCETLGIYQNFRKGNHLKGATYLFYEFYRVH